MTVDFTVAIKEDEDGALYAEVLELPGCFTQGRDEATILERVPDAIHAYLDTGRPHVRVRSTHIVSA